MNRTNDDAPFVKAMATGLAANLGVDCPGENAGDWRDAEGLLVCCSCGKHKERVHDVPYLGKRIHRILCDCGKEALRLRDERQKQREEQAFVDSLFAYSLIDKRFLSSTFSNCIRTEHNAKAIKIANGYVSMFDEMFDRNKGLLFHGDTGTGKTYLAACIANALLERRVPLIYTSILKLTNDGGPYSKSAKDISNMLYAMNAARLLIIDDLGTERGSDFKQEQVYEIIDSRYGSKRPMIVTTNISLDEMQNESDRKRRRIYERIIEVTHPVGFTGPSWRTNTAANDFDDIRKMLLG